MKNFLFPQIFVPVVGSNDGMISAVQTKFRYRTSTQPQDKDDSLHLNLSKALRLNVMVQPPKTGKLRISLFPNSQVGKECLEGSQSKMRETLRKSFLKDQNMKQMSKTIGSENKFRISEATTKRLWPIKKDKDLQKQNNVKMNQKDLNKNINKNKGENMLIQKPVKGLKKYSTNIIKQGNKNRLKTKQKSTQKKLNKKLKAKMQKQNSIKEQSLKSQNSQGLGTSKIISKCSTSRVRRRNGVQTDIQLTGIRMTEQMKRVVNINNRILGNTVSGHFLKKTKHDLRVGQDQDERQQENIRKSVQQNEKDHENSLNKGICKRSISIINIQNDQYSQCQNAQYDVQCIHTSNHQNRKYSNQQAKTEATQPRFQRTCHLLDSKRPRQVRRHKRTYTIWDTQSSSQNEKAVSVEDRIQKAEDIENKSPLQNKLKSMKKVRFSKTSFDLKMEKQKKTHRDFPASDDSKRSIKNKGFLQRNLNQEPHCPSIKNHMTVDCEQNKKKKIFSNVLNEKKKAPRLKKVDQQNVYNELNYFRMRLNLTEPPQEEEIEVAKNFPQNIIFSVEKVKNELDYERIDNIKRTNEMIDFGVRFTKDYFLDQRGVRDRAIYNFY